MPIQKFWKAKTPTLQLRALNELAYSGPSSKKRLSVNINAKYSDVSDAVKSLNERGLIKKTSPPHLRPLPPRSEIFYKLTNEGFRFFLSQDLDPEEFWASTISFCKSYQRVTVGVLEGYLNLFIDNYIGIGIYNEYSFYSNLYHVFDNILKRYWHENKESFRREEDDVPLSQKILEFLSLNRGSTKEEISIGVGEPVYRIKSFLEETCLDFYNSVQYLVTSNDPEAILERYRELVDHSLIVSSPTGQDQDSSYELSLFGIILILFVVRTEQTFRHFNREKKRTKFYSIEMESFFEKLALNYNSKLPLIFGKWEILKEKLLIGSGLPFLFDPVFYDEERVNYFSLPITEGGNKEIYDSILAISDTTARKLSEIYETGIRSINDFDVGEPLVSMMRSTLIKIEARLGYTNIKSSLRYLGKDSTQMGNYFKMIEEMFSKEITFIFYLALLRKVPYDYQSTNEKILPLLSRGKYSFASAMDMISNLMKSDQVIRSLIRKWVNDASNYQSLVDKQMQSLKEELNVSH